MLISVLRSRSAACRVWFHSAPACASTSAPPPAALTPSSPAAAAAAVAPAPAAAPAGLSSLVGGAVSADGALSHIGGWDKHGFTVNGLHLRGSVLVFPRFSLLWHVPGGVATVSPRVLAAAHMVRPRPELLLLGTGATSANVNPALYAYCARRGMALEALPTPAAIATFNELVAEGRAVAAALVCATPMSRADACLYTHAPAAAAASAADRRLARVLARDVGADAAQRLLGRRARLRLPA